MYCSTIRHRNRTPSEGDHCMVSDRRHEGRHDTGNRYAGLLPGNSMAQARKIGTTTRTVMPCLPGFTPYYPAWYGAERRQCSSETAVRPPIRKKIWKAVMSRIHEDLPFFADFEKPDGIVTATVCKESGKACHRRRMYERSARQHGAYTEYFSNRLLAPTDYCDHHILANICADSDGSPAQIVRTPTRNRRIRDWRLCEHRGCSLAF